MKILYFLITMLIFSPLIYATTDLLECQRVTTTKDVPCDIIATYKPSTGCVTPVSIFSENGTNVQNYTWRNAEPFCRFTWNITSPLETYVYNSSIETGAITLEKEDNMLVIIIAQIFIISLFVLAGFPHKIGFLKFFLWSMALAELILTIWFVYMIEANVDIIPFLYINSIAALILGGFFGILSLIAMLTKLANPTKDKVVNEDSYTKYVFNNDAKFRER